jgi:hypothetical protein
VLLDLVWAFRPRYPQLSNYCARTKTSINSISYSLILGAAFSGKAGAAISVGYPAGLCRCQNA